MNVSQNLIVDYTLYLLGFFSLLSWIVILFKAGETIWHRVLNHRFLERYHQKAGLDQQSNQNSQFGRLYQQGSQLLNQLTEPHSLNQEYFQSWQTLLEGKFKQQIQKERAKLDAGLGWLATFGSISPFVGLFGTVWGIMNALKDITAKGSASLEVVAGPIGEALIATALGIAVAIPAVIGYNVFLRQNRSLVQNLEYFANDFLHNTLHQYLLEQSVSAHGYSDPK